MNKKNTILILLDNPFTNDRRVYREALSLLETGYKVIVVCVKKQNLPNEEINNGIIIKRFFSNDIFDPKKTLCFKRYAKQIIDNIEFDSIHANDQTMLHLGVKIKTKLPLIKLIYDSHELFRAWPLNTSAKGWVYLKSLIVRSYLKSREAKNIKKIDGLITVNESIRKDIITHFKLEVNSISLRNIPELPSVVNKRNILREKFNLKASDKILVYIGANIYPKTINIEQVIKEFSNKKDVYMIFICAFNWGKQEVENFANDNSVKNLFFHNLITPSEINDYLSSADAGIVSSWNKNDLSYWYGLDNKLFEYMMSGIPIVATRQPEYLQIVEKYKLGLCIDPDKENYYDAFVNIIADKDKYSANIKEAKKILNWKVESTKLINFYKYYQQ